MLPFCFFALLLLKGSDSCRRSGGGEILNVTPANSTHIHISWEGVFESCSDANVEEVYVRKYGGQTLYAKYSDKRVQVELSPCLHHRMMVTLDLGKRRDLSSDSVIYNELKYETKYSSYKTLYAGSLNKEIVQKTCMEKTNMILTIPDVPLSLTKCIVEKEIRSSIILGQSLRIRFVIVNPENEHQFINVEADVDKLDFCQDENPTERNKENSTERGQESVTERKMENTTERGEETATEKGEGITSERGKENTTERGKENTIERVKEEIITETDAKENRAETEAQGFFIFIGLASIPVTFTLVGLIYLCRTQFKRQRKCCSLCVSLEKKDDNPDYGTYYNPDGERWQDVMEVSLKINTSPTSQYQVKKAVDLHIFTSFINTQFIKRAMKYDKLYKMIQVSDSNPVYGGSLYDNMESNLGTRVHDNNPLYA